MDSKTFERSWNWVSGVEKYLSIPVVFLVGLLVTGVVSWAVAVSIHNENKFRFEVAQRDVERRILNRWSDYESSLMQVKAFFMGSTFVTKEEFHRYAEDYQVWGRYPGILGVGFAPLVRKGNKDTFPILYLEPQTSENKDAIGFDMFSETVRREAMTRARDQETSALSGIVTLLQGVNRDPQLGFLLYIPIYSPGREARSSFEERRRDLSGFIYSPFRSKEFFLGLFPELEQSNSHVAFQVFDQDGVAPNNLLFEFTGTESQYRDNLAADFKSKKDLHIAGRKWQIMIWSLPGFQSPGDKSTPYILAVIGTLLTFLISGFAYATRRKSEAERELLEAEQLARSRLEEQVRLRTQELTTEREYLNALLESLEAGVIARDSKGHLTLFNRAARDLFHSRPESVEIVEQMFDSQGSPLVRALHGESVKNEEMTVDDLDYGRHFLSVSGRSIGGPRNEALGAVAVLHDVTETKIADEKVRQSNLALQSANEELEAFAYSVSHDLRAPLRGIDGFSQALLEDYDKVLDHNGKRYLGFVRDGVQRMGHLIDDLLNLSRLTRVEMRRQRVNLSQMIEEISQVLRRENPERHAIWTIQPGVIVDGDPGLLRALFENLLSNAWKFTAQRAEAQIEFGQFFEAGEEILFVRDNGAGFDMTYADKLFGAFQRLHNASEFKGTGIGLATVRRIVHRHGGRCWAEAKVNDGATFYLTLKGDAR